MIARNLSLLSLALLLVPVTAIAQAAPPEVIERTTETTRTVAEQEQQGLFQQLGWELATADEGVRIERISKNSPVAEAHLEEKDIIKKVAGENVLTAERISEIVSKLRVDGEQQTGIVVLRDGEELSYLLSLDSIAAGGNTTTSQTTERVTQTDLVQMIQQLQFEAEQQRAMLQTLLTEVQSLRLQLGGTPIPPGGVAPVGAVGVPAAVPATKPGTRPGATGTPRPRSPR